MTVILFCVSVPVLSEHMTCVQPSVSTAVSFLMTAERFDILVTPIERTMVTTAASPSGIAATARLTATMKEGSITFGKSIPSPAIDPRTAPTINMTTLMPITINVRILESWASFC